MTANESDAIHVYIYSALCFHWKRSKNDTIVYTSVFNFSIVLVYTHVELFLLLFEINVLYGTTIDDLRVSKGGPETICFKVSLVSGSRAFSIIYRLGGFCFMIIVYVIFSQLHIQNCELSTIVFGCQDSGFITGTISSLQYMYSY